MKRTASFAIALLAGTGLPTLATDLGTLGPTYEIAEPHLLRMIEERLRDKERSGELARIEQEARARGTDIVRNPVPVASVRTTATPRTSGPCQPTPMSITTRLTVRSGRAGSPITRFSITCCRGVRLTKSFRRSRSHLRSWPAPSGWTRP